MTPDPAPAPDVAVTCANPELFTACLHAETASYADCWAATCVARRAHMLDFDRLHDLYIVERRSNDDWVVVRYPGNGTSTQVNYGSAITPDEAFRRFLNEQARAQQEDDDGG